MVKLVCEFGLTCEMINFSSEAVASLDYHFKMITFDTVLGMQRIFSKVQEV